jgi:hypothetical protein
MRALLAWYSHVLLSGGQEEAGASKTRKPKSHIPVPEAPGLRQPELFLSKKKKRRLFSSTAHAAGYFSQIELCYRSGRVESGKKWKIYLVSYKLGREAVDQKAVEDTREYSIGWQPTWLHEEKGSKQDRGKLVFITNSLEQMGGRVPLCYSWHDAQKTRTKNGLWQDMRVTKSLPTNGGILTDNLECFALDTKQSPDMSDFLLRSSRGFIKTCRNKTLLSSFVDGTTDEKIRGYIAKNSEAWMRTLMFTCYVKDMEPQIMYMNRMYTEPEFYINWALQHKMEADSFLPRLVEVDQQRLDDLVKDFNAGAPVGFPAYIENHNMEHPPKQKKEAKKRAVSPLPPRRSKPDEKKAPAPAPAPKKTVKKEHDKKEAKEAAAPPPPTPLPVPKKEHKEKKDEVVEEKTAFKQTKVDDLWNEIWKNASVAAALTKPNTAVIASVQTNSFGNGANRLRTTLTTDAKLAMHYYQSVEVNDKYSLRTAVFGVSKSEKAHWPVVMADLATATLNDQNLVFVVGDPPVVFPVLNLTIPTVDNVKLLDLVHNDVALKSTTPSLYRLLSTRRLYVSSKEDVDSQVSKVELKISSFMSTSGEDDETTVTLSTDGQGEPFAIGDQSLSVEDARKALDAHVSKPWGRMGGRNMYGQQMSQIYLSFYFPFDARPNASLDGREYLRMSTPCFEFFVKKCRFVGEQVDEGGKSVRIDFRLSPEAEATADASFGTIKKS